MEGEARALSYFAFDLNIAPMCLKDTARNGKSQPGAAGAAVTGFLATIKTFEDVWDILWADAFARVADRHFHARACSPRFDFDLPMAGCVSQCIADEIIEHASDGLCIHKDRVNVGRNLTLQFYFLFHGKMRKTLQCIRDKIAERRLRALKRKATGIQL